MAIHGWHIRHHDVSDDNGNARRVTVAVPSSARTARRVIYCADGQVVEALARELTRSPNVEQPFLIGVHSSETVRAEEYLHCSDEHFLAHETFFAGPLRSWAQGELGVPGEREKSVVFGFSNGGAFALNVALRHSERFAAALSFSVPRLPAMPEIPPAGAPTPHVYLAAGNQGPEKSIRKNVLRLSRWLSQHGIPVTVSEKRAGHSMDFWASEFVGACDWLTTIAI